MCASRRNSGFTLSIKNILGRASAWAPRREVVNPCRGFAVKALLISAVFDFSLCCLKGVLLDIPQPKGRTQSSR